MRKWEELPPATDMSTFDDGLDGHVCGDMIMVSMPWQAKGFHPREQGAGTGRGAEGGVSSR